MEETSKKVRQREIKYLPLYCEWFERGWLPQAGLCLSLIDAGIDATELEYGGLMAPEYTGGYWGYNGKNLIGCDIWRRREYYHKVCRQFTPLRQNIVLFMAAMNGEL